MTLPAEQETTGRALGTAAGAVGVAVLLYLAGLWLVRAVWL